MEKDMQLYYSDVRKNMAQYLLPYQRANGCSTRNRVKIIVKYNNQMYFIKLIILQKTKTYLLQRIDPTATTTRSWASQGQPRSRVAF